MGAADRRPPVGKNKLERLFYKNDETHLSQHPDRNFWCICGRCSCRIRLDSCVCRAVCLESWIHCSSRIFYPVRIQILNPDPWRHMILSPAPEEGAGDFYDGLFDAQGGIHREGYKKHKSGRSKCKGCGRPFSGECQRSG